MCNILVVIPARGGSKGIPRKNLRALAGAPLISYSIRTALASKFRPDVFVSTDDEEIALVSRKYGAKIIDRSEKISRDETTLDPVIFDAYRRASSIESKNYDIIVTLQPTSPLVKTESLDESLSQMLKEISTDTVISATNDTHLTWKLVDNRYIPNYKNRVNRQFLEPIFKETGGFLITRSSIITEQSRIGENVQLHILNGGEAIDIDTHEDWSLCEFHLKRKKILFVVSGYPEIGLGHVYNTLLIANDILQHHVEFLVDARSQLALEKIKLKNYPVRAQTHENIVTDILEVSPDVVINDRLDTTSDYILSIKNAGIAVINFEDLGDGAQQADLVINAIYPEKTPLPKHYFGHQYFVLRDEFLLTAKHQIKDSVKHVLLTFGGVDPNNLTQKVLGAIYEYCTQKDIEISVVAGYGYSAYESLSGFKSVSIYKNSPSISEHMHRADVIFTSAGRTAYEAASLSTPTIVLAQNERELSHSFASAENGFINLGLGSQQADSAILQSLADLVENTQQRRYMSSLMTNTDLGRGRSRVINLINNLLEEP